MIMNSNSDYTLCNLDSHICSSNAYTDSRYSLNGTVSQQCDIEEERYEYIHPEVTSRLEPRLQGEYGTTLQLQQYDPRSHGGGGHGAPGMLQHQSTPLYALHHTSQLCDLRQSGRMLQYPPPSVYYPSGGVDSPADICGNEYSSLSSSGRGSCMLPPVNYSSYYNSTGTMTGGVHAPSELCCSDPQLPCGHCLEQDGGLSRSYCLSSGGLGSNGRFTLFDPSFGHSIQEQHRQQTTYKWMTVKRSHPKATPTGSINRTLIIVLAFCSLLILFTNTNIIVLNCGKQPNS